MSNTALANIFIEIVAVLAISLELNPYILIFPMIFACSTAFMLPVGTPPGAIAFSYNRLKITDMMLAGFFVDLMSFLVISGYIWFMGPVILGIEKDVFPDWANETNSCLFDDDKDF